MAKIVKSNLIRILIFFIIFSLAAVWWFSVTKAKAPTIFAVDFQIDNIQIAVNDNYDGKIDINSITFQSFDQMAELEFFALPQRCLGELLSGIKRNLLIYPYCEDPIGFAIMRPQDYAWTINRPVRIVIGACRQGVDCEENPEEFQVGFISKEIIGPYPDPGIYPLTPW